MYFFLNTSTPSPAVNFKSATYNAASQTVNFHLAKTVDARDVYQIGNSLYAAPLKDTTGLLINEDTTNLGGTFQVILTNRPKSTLITNGPYSPVFNPTGW